MADYDLTPGIQGGFLRLHAPITPGPIREADGQPYTPPVPKNPQDDTIRQESPTHATRGTIGVAPTERYIRIASITDIIPISATECEIIYAFGAQTSVTVNHSAEDLRLMIGSRY